MTGPYNANDDGPAYLYLAQRLLSTGGLIDPFSTRRLNSYGGAELFQALTLRFAGTGAGLGVEWFLFALLLVALVVRSLRRPYAVLILLTFGLAIVLIRPVGIWVNAAPTFSGAALIVALALVLGDIDTTRPERWRFCVCGLLLAALFALRLEFFVPAVLAVLVYAVVVFRGRRVLGALAAVAIAGVIAIAGWAVALFESSHTPLFPLFASYWTEGSQWKDPTVKTIGQYLNHLVADAKAANWDLVVFGSLLVVGGLFLFYRLGRGRGWWPPLATPPDFPRRFAVLCCVAFGCAASLVFETFNLSGAVLSDIGRYSASSALACLCLAIDLLIDLATARRLKVADMPSSVGRHPDWAVPALRVSIGALGAVLILVALGAPLSTYKSAFTADAHDFEHVVSGSFVVPDKWAAQRPFYTKMNAKIPSGAYLLAAVELPGLLDMGRFSFTSLDVPGGASPPPHLPYDRGIAPVLVYLHRLHITGIVATAPGAAGLYNFAAAEANLTSGVPYYRQSAQYTVWWDELVRALTHRYHTVRVGRLEYLSLSAENLRTGQTSS